MFYFADCDPSGWNMTVEVARKLQALTVGWFPDLEFACFRVGLTPDQVREYGLPSTPLKDSDPRADAWIQQHGVAQTEIDALATLQPELLEQIARAALDPFFDHGLKARVNVVKLEWLRAAREIVDERLGPDLRDQILDIADQFDALDQSDFDLPPVAVLKAKHDPHRPLGNPLIHSRWDFAQQTRTLQKAKSYNNVTKSDAQKKAQRINALKKQRDKAIRDLRGE